MVRKYGSFTQPIYAALVESPHLPCCAAGTVLVLRPRDSLETTTGQFHRSYLTSRTASRQLTRFPRFGPDLAAEILDRLPIPILDETLRKSFEDLERGQRELRQWASDGATVLSSVFEKRNPVEARRALLDGGRLLRQRAEAGRLLTDIVNIVRTQYPYPIAQRWRDVEVSLSSDDPTRALRAIAACYEITVCYVAQLCLVAARLHTTPVPHLKVLQTKIGSGRTGPTLGDWLAIISFVANSKAFRQLPDGGELLEVRDFLGTDSDSLAASKALTDWRNDDAHLRSLTSTELRSSLDHLYESLRVVLKEAAFLADLPLVRVERVDWDSLAGQGTARIQRLAGDHASVPYTSARTADPALERGSLYCESTTGSLHLLRPFLIGTECAMCHRWSTFHVDRYRDGVVELKSLENGHITEAHGMAGALQAVGLLSG